MHLTFESSPLLNEISGIRHGFFTRETGASRGEFAFANCSLKVCDEISTVNVNKEAALNSLGLNEHVLFLPNICHGNTVIAIGNDSFQEEIALSDADALITHLDFIALAITYADCLPILMASQDGSFIAAIHAGWRGILNGVIPNTIEKVGKLFGRKVLYAAIGPCISEEGFIVTGETLQSFLTHWPKMVTQKGNKFHVDLSQIAHRQLKNAGIDAIQKVGGFTDLDRKRYYSHRAEKGRTGRHIAIIAKK